MDSCNIDSVFIVCEWTNGIFMHYKNVDRVLLSVDLKPKDSYGDAFNLYHSSSFEIGFGVGKFLAQCKNGAVSSAPPIRVLLMPTHTLRRVLQRTLGHCSDLLVGRITMDRLVELTEVGLIRSLSSHARIGVHMRL